MPSTFYGLTIAGSKYWENNSSLGLYEKKLYYMNQIEEYFKDDDSSKGFTTILNSMFNNLESLAGAPGDLDRRKTFISSCQDFATYFNSVSIGLNQIQTDANLEVKSTVDNIYSAFYVTFLVCIFNTEDEISAFMFCNKVCI